MSNVAQFGLTILAEATVIHADGTTDAEPEDAA